MMNNAVILENLSRVPSDHNFALIARGSCELIDSLAARNPRHARRQFEALHGRRFDFLGAYTLCERFSSGWARS